jgi:nitrate reductase NapD
MTTNICGCVVHARPGTSSAVAEHLSTLPGVEVHAVGDDDKLVVTVEDTAEGLAADTMGALNRVPGVINAVLVYHYGGDDLDPLPAS